LSVPIILDTDFDTDCDDVGALALAHALACQGHIALQAVVCSAPATQSAACVAAINNFYGAGHIPVGTLDASWYNADCFKDYLQHQSNQRNTEHYHEAVLRRFPISEPCSTNGVNLYRKVLSEAADKSVVVVAIGTLTVLADLLYSSADEYSSLSGMELVDQKVDELVTMALAEFPSGRDRFNWWMHRDAAETVLSEWPGTIVPSEVGTNVLTGSCFLECPEEDPIRIAYETYLGGAGRQRPSWDQVALLLASPAHRSCFDRKTGFELAYSSETGDHQWRSELGGRFQRSSPLVTEEELASIISALMTFRPNQFG